VSELGYGQALILGALQGITEFLPVSSSGHLALAEKIMHLGAGGPTMLLFNIFAHLGTLAAVLIGFAGAIRAFALRLHTEWKQAAAPRQYAWRIVIHMLAATAITGAVGLPFQSFFESGFSSPPRIGAALILTGLLLLAIRFVRRGQLSWRAMKWHHSVGIGIAQAAAILPGLSRSGSTICMAMACGLRRRWAAQFSFLIAVPAILGATAKKLLDTMHLPPEALEGIHLGPILVGAIAALITGVAALKFLMGTVNHGRLHYFSIYCIALGLLVLALL